MKKIICSLIVICTFLSALPAYANATTMTVEQAVEYALEHSDAFAKKDAEILTATYTLYQASLAEKRLKKMPEVPSMTIDVYLSYVGYYTDAARFGETVAKRGKEDLEKSIQRDVKNDFYTYLNSVEIKNTAEENMQITQERMAAAKQKLDLGLISRLDYENFVLASKGAENSYNQAVRDCDYNLIKLKNTMNFPVESQLVPVGEFMYEPKEVLAAEEAIKKSREGNAYLNIYDTFELSKEKWKFYSNYYTSSQYEYKIEEGNFNAAQTDFRTNVNTLDMNIRSMYNSLLTIKEQIEYTQGYVDYLEDNAEAMYLRFEMGLVTASDWRQAQQEYFKTKNDLRALELTYFVNCMTYEGLFE